MKDFLLGHKLYLLKKNSVGIDYKSFFLQSGHKVKELFQSLLLAHGSTCARYAAVVRVLLLRLPVEHGEPGPEVEAESLRGQLGVLLR